VVFGAYDSYPNNFVSNFQRQRYCNNHASKKPCVLRPVPCKAPLPSYLTAAFFSLLISENRSRDLYSGLSRRTRCDGVGFGSRTGQVLLMWSTLTSGSGLVGWQFWKGVDQCHLGWFYPRVPTFSIKNANCFVSRELSGTRVAY